MSLDVYLDRTCTCGETTETVFTSNITHNLNLMAAAADIYQHVWRPEELGITRAGELIEPLRKGIAAMKAAPATFLALEPENKWGTYARFVPWLEEYLAACEAHPEAVIRVSR